MDVIMPESTPAEAVQKQQQKDADRLAERLGHVSVGDLTVSYTLEKSATVLPGLVVRFIAVAVLFRLNSAKKWRLALEQETAAGAGETLAGDRGTGRVDREGAPSTGFRHRCSWIRSVGR